MPSKVLPVCRSLPTPSNALKIDFSGFSSAWLEFFDVLSATFDGMLHHVFAHRTKPSDNCVITIILQHRSQAVKLASVIIITSYRPWREHRHRQRSWGASRRRGSGAPMDRSPSRICSSGCWWWCGTWWKRNLIEDCDVHHLHTTAASRQRPRATSKWNHAGIPQLLPCF